MIEDRCGVATARRETVPDTIFLANFKSFRKIACPLFFVLVGLTVALISADLHGYSCQHGIILRRNLCVIHMRR
jgi:hypothetical protein